MSTTKKGISGLTGQFPEEMIGDIYPRFFTQYLYNGPDLGEILKKCYDNKLRIKNEQDQPIVSPVRQS